MSRLPGGGLIDRSTPLRFSFDGKGYTGFAGDTLASALIANDVRLVGRSFKYHRPRGILTAGSEETNALVTLRTDARAEPNTRATTVDLYDGLAAESQNRWPSLAFDLMAINQLFAPLLVAGFYYKTFMWPPSFWEKVYEPLIRRMAGLGRLSGRPDPDVYDRNHGFCDLLVIGAGPAGLGAALTAGRAGARVILCNEEGLMGGRLLAERHEVDGEPGSDWAQRVVAELASLPNVRLMPRCSVFGVFDGREYGAIERLADHMAEPADGQPRQRYWKIVARRAVLASGALERPLVFGGNDRPGVMMASAMSTYVNRYAVVPGKRAVIFTTSDSGWLTARDLLAQGVDVAAIVEARPEKPAAAFLAGHDIEILTGAVVTEAIGSDLRAVRVREAEGRHRRIACDMLGMSGGWNPSIGLASHLGERPVWHASRQNFFADKAPPGMIVAGAANGRYALAEALADGCRSGARVAAELGFRDGPVDLPRTSVDPVEAQPLWYVAGSRGKAFVDFQNDVTDADIRLAAREGFTALEHMKRYTTLGMGTDQGKMSVPNGHAILADASGTALADIGTILSRPPYQPVAIGALAGRLRDEHYRPVRLTSGHQWALEQSATFVDVERWKRARWFARPGDTHWQDAVNREVVAVRTAVGICDVSTLGKVDIQGPDAATLIDRLYINSFQKLPVGRARYGVMLREDGFVFDDGTVTRFSGDRYFLTTTTGNAARVMQHIDYCRQVLWPELDVQVCSVTEQWATYAVAGPLSRGLLQAFLPQTDLSNKGLAYLEATECEWGESPLRLVRISFSGELGYEINVPARYGDKFVRALFNAGQPFGLIPYGTEALRVLRIEKGHVAGSELNGQTTAADLGLARLMSTNKDFIGRVMAMRPGLCDPIRPALVGLRAVDRRSVIRAGAHLLPLGAKAAARHGQGHVTSATWSANLGHSIALALLEHGPERHGQHIMVHDPVRGNPVEAEICSPIFIDPEGEHVRG
jgi:heterotetrameric sarcosine oxidase alpha subunit